MKVSSNRIIKVWTQHFNTFQDYLPRILWIAGARRSEWPKAFDKERKREILEFALPHTHLIALSSESWCLSENTFEESIGKITEIEPMILAQEKDKKLTAAKATAIKELQDSIANKGKGKRTGGGGGGGRSDSANKDKGNGPVNKEGYYLCGTCNKRHNGTCRLLSSESNPRNTPTKKWMSRSETKEYIKTMVSSCQRRKGKRRRSYSSSDSSSDEEESWRSSLNGAKQMHVLASAGINPSDNNIEIENDDLRRYRKQAMKWSKKQRRS